VSVTERSGGSTEFFDPLLVFGFERLHLLRVVVVLRERSEDSGGTQIVLSSDGERVFSAVDHPTLDVENGDTRPCDSGVTRSDVVVPNDVDHTTQYLGNTLDPVVDIDSLTSFECGELQTPIIAPDCFSTGDTHIG